MGQAVVHPSLLSVAGCCRSSCPHPLSPLLVAPPVPLTRCIVWAIPHLPEAKPVSWSAQSSLSHRGGKQSWVLRQGTMEAVRLKGAQEVGFVFWMD